MRGIYSAFFISQKKRIRNASENKRAWVRISVDEKWFLFAFMYKCDMQNAFDFVSHSAGHKSLSAVHKQKKERFFAFRYNGDKLHFLLITGRGVIFSLQFLLQFMLGDCIFYAMLNYSSISGDRQHGKKLVYMPNSPSRVSWTF